MSRPASQTRRRAEARAFIRYRTQLPVTLQCRDGEAPIQATVAVISANGLEVRCSRRETLRILPAGHRATPDGPQNLVDFLLTINPGPTGEIGATARPVSSRRVAQDAYHVGLRIIDMSDADKNRLADFLEECTPLP